MQMALFTPSPVQNPQVACDLGLGTRITQLSILVVEYHRPNSHRNNNQLDVQTIMCVTVMVSGQFSSL